MDRRVRKNQTAIMKAFMHLIEDKEFDKITMNDIAAQADVNRGTIYSHYADKYELLDQCIEMQMAQLIESCYAVEENDTFPSRASLLRTLELIENNTFFHKLYLDNKGVPSFKNHLRSMMSQRMLEHINETHVNLDKLSQVISAQFLSSAVAGVIEWWLTDPTACSAEEITERLGSLLDHSDIITS